MLRCSSHSRAQRGIGLKLDPCFSLPRPILLPSSLSPETTPSIGHTYLNPHLRLCFQKPNSLTLSFLGVPNTLHPDLFLFP